MNRQELEGLIDDGCSQRQIAKITGKSRSTITYWMDKYELCTINKKKSSQRSSFDWKLIQRHYDKGLLFRELGDKFNVSKSTLLRAQQKGLFSTRSQSESNKISQQRRPRKHSEETKAKLSRIRKEYLRENPDKVPYLLNHCSKGASYPEKYFAEVFEKEGIQLERYFRVGLYQLDFADVDKKIDLEIDGSQHKKDPRIVEHDKKRTANLEEMGWTVIRVYWPEYQKKTYDQKVEVVRGLKKILGC